MNSLTEKQQAIFDFIREGILGTGKAPSLRAIAARFKMVPNGALTHVRALEKKGFLKSIQGRIVLSYLRSNADE